MRKGYFYGMDSKNLSERLTQLSLLKGDNESEWKKITENYPYFSVAHLLMYANDELKGQGNLQKAGLFKQDPLLFAQFVKSVQELKKQGKEMVDLEIKPNIEKETKIIEPIKSVEVKENTIEPKSVAAIDEKPISQIAYAEILDEVRTYRVDDKIETEDILNLINELPNTSLFDSELTLNVNADAQEPVSEMEELNYEPTSIAPQTAKTDEDVSLMVMMSFTDWLNHFKKKSESEKNEHQEKKALKTAWQKEKLAEAADEEIDEIPEPIFKQAMNSISEESDLISESLAEILAKQGKHEKAISMYKKLSLRNPEKSAYFADRIYELTLNLD